MINAKKYLDIINFVVILLNFISGGCRIYNKKKKLEKFKCWKNNKRLYQWLLKVLIILNNIYL